MASSEVSSNPHPIGSRTSGRARWIAFAAPFLFAYCETTYYIEDASSDLPLFVSDEPGIVYESSWTVTARATDWDVISVFKVGVRVADKRPSADSGTDDDTADTAGRTTNTATTPTVRVSLGVDDDLPQTIEREYSWIYPDSIGADLERCVEEVCTHTVHVRVESLTEEIVNLEATLETYFGFPHGCSGGTKETEAAAGLEISLTEVTDEASSAATPGGLR